MSTASPEKVKYGTMLVSKLAEMLNPANPRVMREDMLEALGASLKAFDCVDPIVINTRFGRIVGGHQRVGAAQKEGIKVLPIALIDVDEEHEKAFNVGLNKVRGTWDFEKLAEVLQSMKDDEMSFVGTGFDDDEIESICNQYSMGLEELDESVTRRFDNKTAEEVAATIASITTVQFGQFQVKLETPEYEKWVAMLAEKSTQGSSPVALGAVVAQMLELAIVAEEPKEEDEVIAEDYEEEEIPATGLDELATPDEGVDISEGEDSSADYLGEADEDGEDV
jgi:ParB-like nuclease domain